MVGYAADAATENGMDNEKAAELVYDRNTFRIGALFWLATCNDGMSLPDELKEAIEDGDVMEVFAPLPDYIEDAGVDEVMGWLLDERKLGFLARVETPTPTSVHGSGYSSHGWGMYRMQWVYADTLDVLLSEAERVSNQYIEKVLTELRTKAA